MTTAQRARELASKLNMDGLDSIHEQTELVEFIRSHARMLEAALPEIVQKIANWHQQVSESTNEGVDCDPSLPAHRDRATILDAYRVLTAEHSALREKHNAAMSELIMNVNVATGDRDAARAANLRALDDHEATILRHAEYDDRQSKNMAEMSAILKDMTSQRDAARVERGQWRIAGDAEKQRADRLAEGVKAYRAALDPMLSSEHAVVWERTNGHLVPETK